MPATTFVDYLKKANAALRESPSSITQAQLGKLQEIQAFIDLNGGDHTLWDYPSGLTVISASTANARSTVVDYKKDFYHQHALVRIVSTAGATPTATLQLQGSPDNSTWSNVNYLDYLSPNAALSSANLTITTSTTNIKLIPSGQNFRYFSVLVSADTNVTLTVDVTMLG